MIPLPPPMPPIFLPDSDSGTDMEFDWPPKSKVDIVLQVTEIITEILSCILIMIAIFCPQNYIENKYKMATCQHQHIYTYTDKPLSKNDVNCFGTAYDKCPDCDKEFTHYIMSCVENTEYLIEYDDIKHEASELVVFPRSIPITYLHGKDIADTEISSDGHDWKGWKKAKTYEMGTIQVRKCRICGKEEYKVSGNRMIKEW